MLKLAFIISLSMASPHTAGCVSLAVSALKQRGVDYSPYSIRRALQHTAQALDLDIFAQGHGLIQVQYMTCKLIEKHPSFQVRK